MVWLLVPTVSFSDNHTPLMQDNVASISVAQHAISTTKDTHHPVKKKKILAAHRELGPFFTIGLIINLIMMTSFAVWAVGQWKQNNNRKK